MTKRYTEKPVESWNVRDFIAYLTDENKRRFGVTYAPSGRGTKSQRWGFEQGTLKQAIDKYGSVVVRRFIDECFDEYRSTAQYPCMTWGFIYTYRDHGLQRAEKAVVRERRRGEQAQANGSQELDVEELRKLL